MIDMYIKPPNPWDSEKEDKWAFYNYIDDLVISVIQMNDTPAVTRRIWINGIKRGVQMVHNNGS